MRCNVSPSAVKKTFRHPKAGETSRNAFRCKIKEYHDSKRPVVSIDESGFAHDMPRTHGSAPVGRRCFGQHEWKAKGRINVIGALLNKELLTVTLVDGSIDADVFHAWLRKELLPELLRNSVVVMDNAAFHKPDAIQEVITSCGHELEFLPPYSPDLNPIEHKWAQAKALRRKYRCSVEEFFQQNNL